MAEEMVTVSRTPDGWTLKRYYTADTRGSWLNPQQCQVLPDLDTPRLASELTAWVEDVLRREASGEPPTPGLLTTG